MTPPHQDYVLAQLRCASARARLTAIEIDCAGVALRSNLINPEDAVAWVAEYGVFVDMPEKNGVAA